MREGKLDGWMDGWMEAAGEGVSLDAHLIVMGRELMEQLFDAIFLSWAVHIGHLVLGQGAVVLMNLTRERRRVMNNNTTPTTCEEVDKPKKIHLYIVLQSVKLIK